MFFVEWMQHFLAQQRPVSLVYMYSIHVYDSQSVNGYSITLLNVCEIFVTHTKLSFLHNQLEIT